MQVMYKMQKLTIDNNELPSKGRVQQITKAVAVANNELQFEVECVQGSLEPGRQYIVQATKQGNKLVNVAWQTTN